MECRQTGCHKDAVKIVYEIGGEIVQSKYCLVHLQKKQGGL